MSKQNFMHIHRMHARENRKILLEKELFQVFFLGLALTLSSLQKPLKTRTILFSDLFQLMRQTFPSLYLGNHLPLQTFFLKWDRSAISSCLEICPPSLSLLPSFPLTNRAWELFTSSKQQFSRKVLLCSAMIRRTRCSRNSFCEEAMQCGDR